ncbi:MAG: hypothetical protein LBF67_08095 [Prevotellaceae bacterium]|jgi:hypothetical protein|nr:hypothetical protein [Prevotellaceae bacterium]
MKKIITCFILLLSTVFPLTTPAQPAVDSTHTGDMQLDPDLSSDVVTLDIDEADYESGQNISSLLGASRDVFSSQVAYSLSTFRFRERGYESSYSSIYFNGFSLQDPETGYANYNVWSGLNEALRGYTSVYGLEPSETSFGNFAGVTTYNTKASSYRKQNSVSIAMSNRTYDCRLMATIASGLMEQQWAYTFSASTRLGMSGYMEGTPYEAFSFFLSVEKQFAKRHSLNLTVLSVELQRGMSSAVIQEAYDLYGSYSYNPRWGYYRGVPRTARIRSTHQPLAMLNYAWRISEKSKLEAGVSILAGPNGTSDLDWSDGNDPRPDYYRKFPSYEVDPAMKEWYAQLWKAHDPTTTQINWNALIKGNYDANRANLFGDWKAVTIVKEYRNDQQTLRGFASYVNHFNRYVSLYGGLEAQAYKGMFFQLVKDALGADYYLNVDKFAVNDNALTPQNAYYDVNDSNLKKRVGDKFGYDYNIFHNNASGWVQVKLSHGRFECYLTEMTGYTEFWRNGKMNNGRFSATGRSYGKSKKEAFVYNAVKANATCKITGRNYLTLSAAHELRPPLFKNIYLQERYHDFTAADYGLGIKNETIYSADASYHYRGTNLRLRMSGYYTQSKDASEVKVFYMEGTSALVEYIAQGVDKRYMGGELGASCKLTSTLTLDGALAHGWYGYTSNPNTAVIADNEAAKFDAIVFHKAYITGYNIGGKPQTAGTLSLTYRSPRYWFVGITGSFAANSYIEINYDRRTYEAMSFLPGTPQYMQQLEQEKYPTACTLDAFGGASWRIKDGRTFGVNGNVQNMLDKNFKTGGFEQLRYDVALLEKFPSKYYYSFGLTFFVQMYYRF